MGKDKTELLYFCVGFHELSHLTRDLSHTEKKIAVKVQLFRKGHKILKKSPTCFDTTE